MNIAIMGAAGRMGRMLVKEVTMTDGCRISGATGREGSSLIGVDVGELAGVKALGVAITEDPAEVIARADAVIDFTTPAATVDHTRLCAQANAVHVVGTTGLGKDDEAALELAARHAQVVYAPNMSVGVNLLLALTEKVASILGGDDYDIEIVEMHHRHKVDAPSGTALGLGKAAAKGRGVDHDHAAVYSREGHTGARVPGKIGYATLRGGDVVGEHSVIFAAAGERIEITHKATDRRIFAAGSVRAAKWARSQPYGLYTMRDVLGLD
ncbi:4-hydroxy-tetrahydrodipicolinate reductase [Rhodospirillaceae bacterium KN72]|uniref:4-hydroxy-tetrahydrodipicolinate reductase n=1 Tax=Pacificispira spongiicola TaxID=2729598 RepID=A0A7Y0HFC7_9PROT|nr:4-hydroxy-tetrahydrodipicolinate reductase [Pacificispira spongiicola]NMM43822.1 4-hydroxy-tetrahydrodipicolinate reductase [Pacificispira spongiicola]